MSAMKEVEYPWPMRWITVFLIVAAILTLMSVAVVAEYGRIRKAQEKEQYDDALKIALVQYKSIVFIVSTNFL